MELKTIIINASAAKTGGAETIIDTFIEYLEHDISGNRYILLCPKIYNTKNKNIISVKKSTHSISTFLFTTLFVYKYCLQYKATKILSFNNLNLVLPFVERITYFHQPKDLKENYFGIRRLIYYIIIKLFLHKNDFIVQSDLIKSLFVKKFGLHSDKVSVVWPGFKIPYINDIYNKANLSKKINELLIESKILDRLTGICPIAYNGSHKNLKLLFKYGVFFEQQNACILSLLDNINIGKSDSIKLIGKLSREELFLLYDKVDFMVFTSTDETVGLPIFEFLQTGKIAFVYEAEYAKMYFEKFHQPDNLILFNEDNFEELFLSKINLKRITPIDYSKGEWEKIKL